MPLPGLSVRVRVRVRVHVCVCVSVRAHMRAPFPCPFRILLNHTLSTSIIPSTFFLPTHASGLSHLASVYETLPNSPQSDLDLPPSLLLALFRPTAIFF